MILGRPGADVFVENFRTGTMKHFGVDYDTMQPRNPKLVYCSLSGFGQTGPYASRGGFDLIAQAMSGLMSVTGEGGGRPPVKVGSPCTDIMCGTLGALGISGALRAREISGLGQHLDTSLYVFDAVCLCICTCRQLIDLSLIAGTRRGLC